MGKVYLKLSLTIILIVIIISSCSKPTVTDRIHEEIDEFDEITSVILKEDKLHEGNVSRKGKTEVYKNLVEILTKSKLGKRVNKHKKKNSRRKLKEKQILQDTAGISKLGDTYLSRFINILKTEKCSNLRERIVLVRTYLLHCLTRELKPGRIERFRYKLTTIKRLKAKSNSCRISAEKLEDKLNIIESKKCYYKLYKSGKFLSPLNKLK